MRARSSRWTESRDETVGSRHGPKRPDGKPVVKVDTKARSGGFFVASAETASGTRTSLVPIWPHSGLADMDGAVLTARMHRTGARGRGGLRARRGSTSLWQLTQGRRNDETLCGSARVRDLGRGLRWGECRFRDFEVFVRGVRR